MNESGRSVSEAVRFYKLTPQQVTVFHDEIDLPPGKVRVRTSGGLAGHRGPSSVRDHLKGDFRRVRIGVGHPGDRERVHSHVLGKFSNDDAKWLDPLLDRLVKALTILLNGDDNEFASLVTMPGDYARS